jgi:hypothetical protein
MKMRSFLLLLFCVGLLQSAFAQHSPAYLSADRKISAIVAFQANPAKGALTTTLTDAEMNAYFAEGGIKWSEGLSDVKIYDQPAVVNGSALVDFDKITAKNRSNSPFLALFSGVHTVRVTAQAAAIRGRASIKVQSVSLDGLEIPRAALEFFVQKYLQPKYPEADLDTVFGMPDRIDTAIVGDRQITFVQK